MSPLTQPDTFLSLWSVPCDAGCWGYIRKLQRGAQPGGLGAAQGRGARCVTPTQPAVSLRPCPCGHWCRPGGAVRSLPHRRRGVCLPLPAAGHPPLPAAAPGCRSSGVCSPSSPRQHGPLPARPAGPFFPFTQLWVKCGILLPQFPAALYVGLSSLLQHRLERRGLAFPLLCSEAQSNIQAPTELAAPCPMWTLCVVPWTLG